MASGLLVLGAVGVRAQTAPSNLAHDYAILAVRDVRLGGKVQVEGGGVGVNAKSGTLTLAGRARVDGPVAADTIRLGKGARVEDGSLFCTTLAPREVTSATCPSTPLELPLVDPLPCSAQASPGNEAVRLPRLGSQTLVAGAYGVVRVGGRARLSLAGGDYDFRSLWIGRKAEVVCEGPPCVIRVRENVVVREFACLAKSCPSTSSTADASAIRLEVAARGGVAAVRTYLRSDVQANVCAPNGGIVLGMSGRYMGAFIGDSVDVFPRARITGASAF